MLPREFWRSTPRDVSDMARGARWRNRREWERVAWLASYVIAPHTKRPPSMRRMLAFLGPDEDAAARGQGKAKGPADKTPEGIKAFIDGLARKHKAHAWTMLNDKYANVDGDKE